MYGQTTTMEKIGKRSYSVDEIRQILGIGRRQAYELCNSGCFPIIRVGHIIRVSKASFDHWLDHTTNNGG
jgi:excisionase family DNA binding protein